MNARFFVALGLLLALAPCASARPVVYVASLHEGIYAVSDLNGDGDCLDVGEVVLWADSVGTVWEMTAYGAGLLVADGSTDQILLCLDLNGDGDALDVGEAILWAETPSTSYGMAACADGSVLVTRYLPGQVWRFCDLNGDGDALDEGESTLYADGMSGLTDIVVRTNDVLVASYLDDHVRRLVDLNGDGDALDVVENMDHTPSDIPLPVGLLGGPSGAYFVAAVGTDAIFRVEDRNGDGDAFDVIEVLSYADSVYEPIGYPWALVDYPGLGMLVTEYTDSQVSLIRDLNGDGDALDIGEVMLYADAVSVPTAMVYVGDPLSIAAELDYPWVYQNTLATTQDRHRCTLTVTIIQESLPGEGYVLAIGENGGPLVDFTTADIGEALVIEIVGGRTNTSVPSAPAWHTLNVTLTGLVSGRSDTADVALKLCRIGDITGDGFINALDKAHMNAWLNGMPLPGDTVRHLDLTGDGFVNAVDKVQINRQLNGLGIL